jgi:hypothetical protein
MVMEDRTKADLVHMREGMSVSWTPSGLKKEKSSRMKETESGPDHKGSSMRMYVVW